MVTIGGATLNTTVDQMGRTAHAFRQSLCLKGIHSLEGIRSVALGCKRHRCVTDEKRELELEVQTLVPHLQTAGQSLCEVALNVGSLFWETERNCLTEIVGQVRGEEVSNAIDHPASTSG